MELARDESLRSMQAQLDSGDFDPATLSQSELSLAKHLMTITRKVRLSRVGYWSDSRARLADSKINAKPDKRLTVVMAIFIVMHRAA